jgi:hypothetical protein
MCRLLTRSDSSVGNTIRLWAGQPGFGSRQQIFFLLNSLQIGSGVYASFYPRVTGTVSRGGKATEP